MKNLNFQWAVLAVLLFGLPARAAVDFVFEQDSSIPIVNVSVAFRMGTASDPAELSGLTAFMGEMLMRGTKVRSKKQLEDKLDELGSSLSMDVRAELLIVRGAVLSNQLKPFLALISEIMLEPSFPEREVTKLKNQTVSELLEERGNDAALARLHFNHFLFGEHPYGQPIDGTIKSVKKIRRDLLVQHYAKNLHRNGIIVAADGDMDPAVIQQWAESLAARLPAGETTSVVKRPAQPEKRRMILVDKPDRTQIPIIAGQIGITFKDPDFFPLYVGNHGFGGGSMFSRLMVEIRVKRGWSYGAYSRFDLGSQPKDWNFSLSPAAKDAPEALKYALHMVEEVRESGLTPEEFSFAQEGLINGAGFMYNTPSKRVENALIEKALNLRPGFFKSYATEIGKLTREQVNASLKLFLRPEALTIAAVASKGMKKDLAAAAGIPENAIVIKPFNQD